MEEVNAETGEVQETGIQLAPQDQLAPAAAALQAQAVAAVQARVLMAIKRPRDIDTFRIKLLKECKRPGFADAAIYSKPVGGGKIEGPSIRFAEAANRLFGNTLVDSQVVSDDDTQRTYRVMAMDLETNVTESGDVVIAKKVERKNPVGREVLSSRRNSKGEPVHIVRATDDEVTTAANSAVSKMRRNKILALLPADIVQEARDQCERTTADHDAKDPDAAKKSLLDAYSRLGITTAEIAEYLGHPTEQLKPEEYKNLRALYQGISQGETNWRAVMESKQGKPEEKKAEQPKGSKADRMAEELKRPALTKQEREPGSDG